MDEKSQTQKYLTGLLAPFRLHDVGDVVEKMWMDTGIRSLKTHKAVLLLHAHSLCVQTLVGESGDGDLTWRIGASDSAERLWIEVTYDDSTTQFTTTRPFTPQALESSFENSFADGGGSAIVWEFLSEQLDPVDRADVFNLLDADCKEFESCLNDAARIENHPSLRTMLREAALEGHREGVSALLALGVSPNQADSLGNMPLHHVAAGGYAELVPMLLDCGALVNEPNDIRKAPLHLAAANGHASTCLTLMAHGANPSLTDLTGRRPCDLVQAPVVCRVLDEARDL